MKTYVQALLSKLNDASGDLDQILVPILNHSREFNNISQSIGSELGLDVDVDVLSVFRISSSLVTSRLHAFPAAEHGAAILTWFTPTDLAEVHNIVANGFPPFVDDQYFGRFGSLSTV